MLSEKAYQIKKNTDFRKIHKKGHSVTSKQFAIYTCNNKEIDHFRLGTSISKKLGDTVLRDRAKRAIRGNLKVHKLYVLTRDIVVAAGQPTKDMTTLQIQSNLEHVLKIVKVFNKKVK